MTLILFIIGIVYFNLPFLSTPLLFTGLYVDKRNYKWYIKGIVLNLALIGYNYIPSITNDLYKHFMRLDSLKDLPLSKVITLQPLIFQSLWFYAVSLTGNYSILPFSAVILTYYYIIKDAVEFGIDEKVSQKVVLSFVIILIVWWQIIWPISGVRSSVAIAFFFHALYKEYIKKEKSLKTYIFYILGALLHYSVFILVALRFVIPIVKRFATIFAFALLTWSFFADMFISILSKLNIKYVREVAEKGAIYSDFGGFSSFTIVNLGIKFILCLICIGTIFMLRNEKSITYTKYKTFYDYGLVISMFCIGSFGNLIILDRFGYLVLSIIPIVVMPLIKTKIGNLVKSLYIISYIPAVILGIFIQYVYLGRATYKVSLFEMITRNIISLFF